MAQPFHLIFTGQNLMGETQNVVGFRQMQADSLTEILITVAENSGADAVFNLKINGVAQFAGADRPRITAGQTTVIKSGLNIAITQFAKVTIDLETGEAVSPIEVGFKYAGDSSGGGSLPPGGITGQVLTKKSGADGDADWQDAPTGGGSGGGIVTDSYNEITWTRIVNLSPNSVNQISRNGTDGGASSIERIIGDGAFKTQLISPLTDQIFLGVSYADIDEGFATIGFCLNARNFFNSNIYQSGNLLGNVGVLNGGETLEWVRTGTSLKLLVNGVEKYEWAVAADRPLHFDINLRHDSDKCRTVYIKGEA